MSFALSVLWAGENVPFRPPPSLNVCSFSFRPGRPAVSGRRFLCGVRVRVRVFGWRDSSNMLAVRWWGDATALCRSVNGVVSLSLCEPINVPGRVLTTSPCSLTQVSWSLFCFAMSTVSASAAFQVFSSCIPCLPTMTDPPFLLIHRQCCPYPCDWSVPEELICEVRPRVDYEGIGDTPDSLMMSCVPLFVVGLFDFMCRW